MLIDESKIQGWIEIWCENNLEGSYEISCKESAQRISYTITNDKKEIKLDFIKANGGLFTISPKVGKNQDVSEMIAEVIYERVNSNLAKSPYSNGFSIKMSEDDFEALISLLKGENDITFEEYIIQDEPGKPRYDSYRLRSIRKDMVVIKYFKNTNRFSFKENHYIYLMR